LRTFRNMTLSTLLALLLFSCACYAQTAEETMLAEARTHFNNGKYYFATTWLGRILINYPASPHRKEVLLLISKAYILSGREEKAVPYLHDLLHEFPETAAKLDPELLELAQSGEPVRPAAIVSPSPPQSPPAEKPIVPVTASKAPAVLAAVKPAETAKTITPPPQKPEQSPPPAKPSPPATAAGQSPATVAATAAAAPMQPPAKTTKQPPAATTVQPPAAVTLPTPGAATTQPRGNGEQVYYVLAGETINRRKIEPLLKKLKGAGLQPIIREETKNREIYRLIADCYDDRNSAEKRLPLIPRMSRNPFLIRNKNSYCIVAGSFASGKAALQEQKRLAGKGLKVEIAKYQVPLVVWQVIIGRFTHAQDAEKVVKTLTARGVAATVIKPWD
jgi:outer membrane biosynthesis protein TonB